MTGGVGDYTQRVAQALARHGEDVHVWTLSGREIPRVDEAVTVHAFPDTFGPRTWAMLARGLLAERGPGRLLVQYVPQAFGFRGMNVGMCSALALQRHHELWTMFHEVATPTAALRHVRPNVLALVTRGMALMLARSSRRMFVSIPGWNDVLARFVPGFEPAMWLPIPSNVEASATSARVEEVRAALAAADRGDAPAGAGGFVVGTSEPTAPSSPRCSSLPSAESSRTSGRRCFSVDAAARSSPPVSWRVRGPTLVESWRRALFLRKKSPRICWRATSRCSRSRMASQVVVRASWRVSPWASRS